MKAKNSDDGAGQYLAKIVITARLERGLTQKKLAKKCGMAQTTIARLEGGRANPRWKTLCRVARALDKKIAFVEK